MNNGQEEEFNIAYKQRILDSFEKYFFNKNIDEAVFDALKGGTVKLTRAYVEFCTICDCIEIIADTGNLPDTDKKILDEILHGIKEIKSDIENIINKISYGMTDL